MLILSFETCQLSIWPAQVRNPLLKIKFFVHPSISFIANKTGRNYWITITVNFCQLVRIWNIILLTKKLEIYIVKPCSEKRRQVKRNFSRVRIGRFCRFYRESTQKWCEISWVIIKSLWNENSACLLT